MHDRGNVPDDLIERYVRGQLQGEELADFEMRMLEEPAFFEAVQLAELMHAAFRNQLRLPARNDNVRPMPLRLWIREPMSMAASILLGIGLLLGGGSYLRDGGTGIDEGYAVRSVINLSALRGAQQETVVPGGVHLLQVDVGISLEATDYLLSIASATTTERHEFLVTADGNGIVRVLTPGTLSGEYKLVVQREDNDEVVAEYQISFD